MKNRTFRPLTLGNFKKIENNLDYEYLSYSTHIRFVYVHKHFLYQNI